MMKILTVIALIPVLLFQCTEKREVLLVENQYDLGAVYKLALFSDSSYHMSFKHPLSGESLSVNGQYFLKSDTICFSEKEYYSGGETGVIKNNFIEFIDGSESHKLEIKETGGIFIRFRNDHKSRNKYSTFSYNAKFHNYIFRSGRPYDLTDTDFENLTAIVTKCMVEQKEAITRPLKSYNGQLVAITNDRNEKEVWINFLCDRSREYKYRIIYTSDGGGCYFSMKVNLTTGKYYDLYINGLASAAHNVPLRT